MNPVQLTDISIRGIRSHQALIASLSDNEIELAFPQIISQLWNTSAGLMSV
jgi:hypothetical protein